MLSPVLRGLSGTLAIWIVGAIALRAFVILPEHCPPIDVASAHASASEAADWIARAQRPDGSYLYEYDAEANAEIPGYNIVRHAGVTMSLYQFAAEGDDSYLDTADRGLEYMTDRLYRRDDWAAFQDSNGDLPLGASALMLAGLELRRDATGDTSYDSLMRELGRFMQTLQLPDGGFLQIWRPSLDGPLPGLRSKYATGEAFWALAMLHRIFPGEGWDEPVLAVADYLALRRDTVEDQEFPPWPDQWAAYGFAEMPAANLALSDDHVTYVRSLAQRFGLIVRVEAQRTGEGWSKLVRGRQARAAGLGTWVEALTSLDRLAGAEPRLADLRPKIAERAICSAGMLAERQVSAEEAADAVHPEIEQGAWFTEGITRMDDQQHALSGLVRTEPIIERERE